MKIMLQSEFHINCDFCVFCLLLSAILILILVILLQLIANGEWRHVQA